MLRQGKKQWKFWFLILSFLMITQVVWWNIVFLGEVGELEAIKKSSISQKYEGRKQEAAQLQIASRASARRLMFLSESVVFLIITGFGLYLLYTTLQKEASSRESQKNFIQFFTHEVKTPITALKLRLESIRERNPEDASIGLALEEVRRLSALFENALNMSRLERRSLVFEEVSLKEIVRSVVRRLEPFFAAKEVECRVNLGTEGVVRGDVYGLSHLIQNLFENAVIHNPESKKLLVVDLEENHKDVVLSVRDNGPGVKDENALVTLCQRFYRGEKAHLNHVSGSGLGLFIAKSMVDAHRGALSLINHRDGGALFKVTIPNLGSVG